jgi:hypothetical protein
MSDPYLIPGTDVLCNKFNILDIGELDLRINDIAIAEAAVLFYAGPPVKRVMVARPIHVIARSSCDEAIQASGVALDCFALLAMTSRVLSQPQRRSSRAAPTSFATSVMPHRKHASRYATLRLRSY